MFFLRLLLIALLLGGYAPPPVTAAPPKDCVVCGHVCCCPEACAPKLDEIKKAEERAAACPTSASVCRPDGTPVAIFSTADKVIPRIGEIIGRVFDLDALTAFLPASPNIRVSAFLHTAVLLPPPRLTI